MGVDVFRFQRRGGHAVELSSGRADWQLARPDGPVPSVASCQVSRLRLAQAGPVIGDLGLSGEQRTQFAFLLCNENTDDLSAQFRHTHPARIGDAFEADHRCRGDMKLHSELTTGTILRRQPRPQDDGNVDGVLANLAIPNRLSDLVTT
jgi:hypothetical protein